MTSFDSHYSRRRLLAGLAAAGAVAAVAMAAKNLSTVGRTTALRDAGSGRVTRPASLATAEMEHWLAEVGSDFDIGYTRMRLAGIQALPLEGDRPEGLRRRPFIAVFDLPQGEVLPGDLVYRIANRHYPAFDIYLAEPSADRLNQMRAVFN